MASEPRIEIKDRIARANRWAPLADFLGLVQEEGLALNRGTPAAIDLDKTAPGARGRSHRAVDAARIYGARRTMQKTLGGGFDALALRSIYDELNQARYRDFTGDNQDVLAYVCLMVVSGIFDGDHLRAELTSGLATRPAFSFDDFLTAYHLRLQRSHRASTALQSVHT